MHVKNTIKKPIGKIPGQMPYPKHAAFYKKKKNATDPKNATKTPQTRTRGWGFIVLCMSVFRAVLRIASCGPMYLLKCTPENGINYIRDLRHLVAGVDFLLWRMDCHRCEKIY